MKRVLALALMAGVLATPSLAQYYGQPGGGGYGGGGGYYQDDDDDDAPRYRRRPRYDGPREDYGDRRPRRAGGICATSRGSCEAPPIPRGSSCRCEIPGFGEKRGIVQ